MGFSAALAILATVFFATANVASKRGVQAVSPLAGIFLSLPAALVVSGIGVLVSGPVTPTWPAVATFAAVGLLTPGLGRLTSFRGMQRLDTSVHVPVQSSAHPITAVLLSYVVLREEVGAMRLVGIGAVLAGVWLISRTMASRPPQLAYETERSRRISGRTALMFPIATGMCYGVADIVRRTGMQMMEAAAFGTMVSVASALVAWATLVAVSPLLRAELHFGRGGRRWFVVHGVINALAILCVFAALAQGDVSVVSPIIASQPFAMMLLAHVALRDLERVTPAKVVGSLLIVGGTSAIVVTA